ncbi:hypothetical protein GW17_00013835 [Ensete ventricosum]|nr:hypothetical protein GW17_00013835 [Ensete ventricosum]
MQYPGGIRSGRFRTLLKSKSPISSSSVGVKLHPTHLHDSPPLVSSDAIVVARRKGNQGGGKKRRDGRKIAREGEGNERRKSAARVSHRIIKSKVYSFTSYHLVWTVHTGPSVDRYVDCSLPDGTIDVASYWMIWDCFRSVMARNKSVTIDFDHRRLLPDGISLAAAWLRREKKEKKKGKEGKEEVDVCGRRTSGWYRG